MNACFTLLPPAVSRLALLALLAGAASANATAYTVSIEYWKFTSPYRYNPSYLQIQVGDTVTWVNADYATYNYHSVYFPASGAYSGPLDVDESVTAQFISPGTYSYYDWDASQYLGVYFSGTIVVVAAAPSQPEPASLTNPVLLSDGRFQCTVSNLTVGKAYTVEMSTDLVNWSGVYTNTAGAGVETYVDSAAMGLGRGFYRVVYYAAP
jgi:plastocyanin